jgi:hypothetical protein
MNYSVSDIKELGAFGVLLVVMLASTFAMWRTVIPRVAKFVEDMQAQSDASNDKVVQAIENLHDKTDRTLESQTRSLQKALSENAEATAKMLQSNQDFVLQVISATKILPPPKRTRTTKPKEPKE